MRSNWRRQHLSEWWTFSCWWRDFYVYYHSEIVLPVCHSRWGHFQGVLGFDEKQIFSGKSGLAVYIFAIIHHRWWAIALLRMLLLHSVIKLFALALWCVCRKDVTLPPLDVKVVRKGHGLVTQKKKQTQMKWKISFHGKKNERNTSSPKSCKKKGTIFIFLFFYFSTSAVMCFNYSIIGTRYATLLCERVLFRILEPHT